MREIKFRQYLWENDSKTKGRMVEWEELLQENEESLASNFTTQFSNASELMQFTGLHDKNGKEIYEGDVVNVNQIEIGYIAFLQQEMGFVIVYKDRDRRLGHRSTGSGYSQETHFEVVGNIYDNPTLSEVEL